MLKWADVSEIKSSVSTLDVENKRICWFSGFYAWIHLHFIKVTYIQIFGLKYKIVLPESTFYICRLVFVFLNLSWKDKEKHNVKCIIQDFISVLIQASNWFVSWAYCLLARLQITENKTECDLIFYISVFELLWYPFPLEIKSKWVLWPRSPGNNSSYTHDFLRGLNLTLCSRVLDNILLWCIIN